MDPDSFPYIATELVEIILDILHEERHLSTLKACSLVSPLFRVLSQKRLFQSLVFRNSYSKSTGSEDGNVLLFSPARDFLQILESSPSIASYIHGLEINSYHHRFGIVDTPAHWLQEADGLPELLDHIHELRRLSITASSKVLSQISMPIRWQSFSINFQTVITNLLKTSTTLTELDITGIDEFPRHLFRHTLSLESLAVGNTSAYIDPYAESQLGGSRRSRLRFLSLDTMLFQYRSLPWLCSSSCAVNLEYLDTLKIIAGENPSSIIWLDHLPDFAQNVPHLYLDMTNAPVNSAYNSLGYSLHAYDRICLPNISRFRALRSLTIDASFTIRIFHHRSLIDYFHSPLSWISGLLEILYNSSSSATLAKVTLNLVFANFPISLARHLQPQWAALASNLSRERFTAFSTLYLRLTAPSSDPGLLGALKEDTYLNRLEKDGILIFI